MAWLFIVRSVLSLQVTGQQQACGWAVLVRSLQLELLLGQQQAGGALLGLSSPRWPVVFPPPATYQDEEHG